MDPTQGLGEQVFGPGNRFSEGRILSQAEGIIEKLTIYTWPSGVTQDDKLSLLAFLPAYGKSEDKRPSAWATWMFTYLVLCFPEFQAAIARENSREFTFVKLPATYVQAMVAICREAEEAEGSEPNSEYTDLLHKLPDMLKFPEIAKEAEYLAPNLAAGQTIPVIYGYASLLIFLAGKKINEKNSITISDKRPQNLINAHGIDEDAAYCLNGDGRLGPDSYGPLNQAWSTHAGARVAIITEVAAFVAGSTQPQRVVRTVSKLLEYSGMQPATFIHKFLQAIPEAATFSCIRPSLHAYVSSVREVAAAPAHLQPLYKVIHGESTRAFHRNSILVLAACAVAYEKYTAPSMKNFSLGEGATSALQMFDAEAVRKGLPTLQVLTFSADKEASAD
jgi:hypothetical protein